jgi:hypothetical protein
MVLWETDFSSTYYRRSTMDDVGSFYYIKDALKNNSLLDYVNYDYSSKGGAIGGSKGQFLKKRNVRMNRFPATNNG